MNSSCMVDPFNRPYGRDINKPGMLRHTGTNGGKPACACGAPALAPCLAPQRSASLAQIALAVLTQVKPGSVQENSCGGQGDRRQWS